MNKLIIAAALLTLTACATSPDKLPTASVSPLQYRGVECEQMVQELDRVNRRHTELHQHLKVLSDGDIAQVAVGMLIFWPMLFAVEGGDGAEAVEFSRIKGEKVALEQVMVERGCTSTVAAAEG